MQYQTRHLEATTDVAHGNDQYAKGERFHASPVDAEYLIGHNKAKAVETAQKPAATLQTKADVEPVKLADTAPEPETVKPTLKPAAKTRGRPVAKKAAAKTAKK